MDGIPVKILRRIFHEAVLQAELEESIRWLVYISHVCRLWREVSLSYASLWASLSISYDGSGGARKRTALIESFDAILRRTGGSALDFFVFLDPYCTKEREAHHAVEHIVKRLISQQRRWRDVTFIWRFEASSDFTDMEFSRSEMPMLRSLLLKTYIDGANGRPIRPYINLSQSSRLTDIYLAGNYFLHCSDQPISTPTTEIILEFVGEWEERRASKVCLDLLKISPQCTTLSAEFYTYTISVESEPAQRDKPDQIIHDIKQLSLKYNDMSPLVLGRLTLPSLEDLSFEVQRHRDAWEVLLKCIQRSLPPLLNLELHGNGGNEEFLIDVLRFLPTLRSLALYSTELSAQLFEELTCYGDSNVSSTFDRRITCPSLKNLRIDTELVDVDDAPACVEAFCTMVETRWKHLKSFKTVRTREEETDACSIRQFQGYLEHCFDDEKMRPVLFVRS